METLNCWEQRTFCPLFIENLKHLISLFLKSVLLVFAIYLWSMYVIAIYWGVIRDKKDQLFNAYNFCAYLPLVNCKNYQRRSCKFLQYLIAISANSINFDTYKGHIYICRMSWHKFNWVLCRKHFIQRNSNYLLKILLGPQIIIKSQCCLCYIATDSLGIRWGTPPRITLSKPF